MADQDLKKHSTTTHDVVTGGIEGAVSSIAIDPFMEKLMHGGELQSPLREGWSGLGKRAAIYAAGGAAATGLIGALVSATSRKRAQRKADRTEMSAIVEFAETLEDRIPRAKKRNRTITAAGLGALALGASTLHGSSKFFGIQGRHAAAKAGFNATNEGGRLVADYIEGAQKILGTGIKGKVTGAVLQNALEKPEGLAARGIAKAFGGQDRNFANVGGQRLALEHYSAFRSSPMRALHFWDWEQGVSHDMKFAKRARMAQPEGGKPAFEVYQESRKPQPFRSEVQPIGQDVRPDLVASHQRRINEMHLGREKAHAAIKEQIEVHGKSEMEAIKHVGYNNNDPQVQNYFLALANHKRAASAVYAKKALLSPALIAAGAGGIVYGRKKNQSPRQAIGSTVRVPVTGFERLDHLIVELDRYDPTSDRSLRAGVRLDKYEKTIRAREIDRHLHDYLRASAIGAVAGAAIPGPRSLKERVLIGAGGGAAVEGVLHATGHKDAYGEQSEDAKILQRNAPKFIGAATVVGGLVARYRRRLQAVKSVVGR